MFLKRSFFKTIVFIKIVVSLTIVNDKPSLTIINDKPSLTIINDKPLLTIVQKRSFFKNNRKKTVANFSKTIIFKNDRYSFSKSSKWVGRFENDIFSETKKNNQQQGRSGSNCNWHYTIQVYVICIYIVQNITNLL